MLNALSNSIATLRTALTAMAAIHAPVNDDLEEIS